MELIDSSSLRPRLGSSNKLIRQACAQQLAIWRSSGFGTAMLAAGRAAFFLKQHVRIPPTKQVVRTVQQALRAIEFSKHCEEIEAPVAEQEAMT